MIQNSFSFILRKSQGTSDTVIARVVGIRGSSPCVLGSLMAMDREGNVYGSFTGGCIESQLIEIMAQYFESSKLSEIVSLSYSDESAFSTGLTCGGEIDVLVERLDTDLIDQWDKNRDQFDSSCIVTEISKSSTFIVACHKSSGHENNSYSVINRDSLGNVRDEIIDTSGAAFLSAALGHAVNLLKNKEESELVRESNFTGGVSEGHGTKKDADSLVFFQTIKRLPRLFNCGATEYALALVELTDGSVFETHVIDPRPVFATKVRFLNAKVVVPDWPDRYFLTLDNDIGEDDAICVLSHDEKVDIPALEYALNSKAFYVGAMGSRGTLGRRLESLRSRNIAENRLARLRCPIGLDLGGKSVHEVAIAILAEIIATRNGGTLEPLS
ncbi:MAG: XdhC family protein, partial [Acidimicrobiales bacterium]|nr:XdhC family protein [Acidimicrobiales bacterium]